MKFDKKTIDSHTHIYNWYDENGESYIDALDTLQSKTGTTGLNILALTTKIYGGSDSNIMAAIYKLHNPTAYAYGGIVYPELPVVPPLPEGLDALTQYRELMEIGFDGIKILYKPDNQKNIVLPINDGFYDNFFTAAENDGTHIIWHVADPKNNWNPDYEVKIWNYSDGTFPSREEMYRQVFDVLEKHPKLNVCFAHFFFMEEEPELLEELFSKYENLCVDVVPGLMFSTFCKNPTFYREFLTKYSDRIIFGTDSEIHENKSSDKLTEAVYKAVTTNETVDIWGNIVTGINLPDEASNKILYENFKNRCADTPKHVNITALKNYIKKYLHLISREQNKKEIVKFLNTI